ncbi:hypothetical protein D3C80_1836670 [compost metagenome]
MPHLFWVFTTKAMSRSASSANGTNATSSSTKASIVPSRKARTMSASTSSVSPLKGTQMQPVKVSASAMLMLLSMAPTRLPTRSAAQVMADPASTITASSNTA